MLLRLLHWLASQHAIYNVIQLLAGAKAVRRRLQRHTAACGGGKTVLDVGGGTGTMRASLPPDCHYICLDNEFPKLQGFRRADPNGSALLADATRMPIPDESVDVVLCIAMSHHLNDEQFDGLLNEANRILKRDGFLLYFDAMLAPRRLAARILWYLDRGSNPRLPEVMERAIAERFKVREREVFAVYHIYLLMIAQRR